MKRIIIEENPNGTYAVKIGNDVEWIKHKADLIDYIEELIYRNDDE